MLILYPIIILCFNFVYIHCDVPNGNVEVKPRRINFASRNARPAEITTTAETVDFTDTSILPPVTLKPTDEAEPKKNVTRVQKQKRRRVVNKTLVPIDNSPTSEKTKESETATIASSNSELKVELNSVLASKSSENKIEPKEISRSPVTDNPATVNSLTQKQVVTETLEQNKSVGGPRTFPKRPAEFNPVFKKRRERDPVVRIINEKNFVYGHNGNFHFSFEGADGTKVFSKGNLLSLPEQKRKAGEAVVGGFAYTDDQGNDYSLSYTADENGYQPVGAHLPTPPPIPPEIARALAFLATKPNPEPTEKYYSYSYY